MYHRRGNVDFISDWGGDLATVVGVMDRDDWGANTDNLVVVDPLHKLLLWVPRDLWCTTIGDRVNTAFARGGHATLNAALSEHAIRADHSLCLRRSAVERALARLAITVPVREPLDLLYPLTPYTRVQDGRKVVRFRPPEERLAGERIHQWIGARRSLTGETGDLARIKRQQVLVRRVLEERVDLGAALADPELFRSSAPAALAEVASARADWRFDIFGDVTQGLRDGKEVLLARRRGAMGRWLAASPVMRAIRRSPPGRLAERVPRAAAWRWRRLRAWVVGRGLVVPSAGVGAAERLVRLLAVVAVRDEMRYLPGFLANVAPHVDGIVALDDGSGDGSGELLAAHPKVLEVLRNPPRRPVWDEVGNYEKLHAAALRHGAGWILAVDADERVEREFRDRAERAIRRGRRLGLSAFAVKLRELWDSHDAYRCDGVWGGKRVARLFAALPDHRFDYRPLHAVKAPLQARVWGRFVGADLEIYHLRTIRREDREMRRDRYKSLDPEARWQPGIGYDYLTDEGGLRLRHVDSRRTFVEGGDGNVA